MPKNLLRRILSTLLLVGGVLCIILALPVLFFKGLMVLVVYLGLREFFDLAEKKGIELSKPLAIVCGVILSLSPSLFWDQVLLASFIFFMFFYQFTRKEPSSTLVPIATYLFGWLYIGWFLSFFCKIRELPEQGILWLCFTIFVAKIGDMAAFAIGSRWGKRPLIPRISPKKSIEGALGGLAASVIVALIFSPFIHSLPKGHVLFLGLCVGIFAQLGDLSESLIKREVGVKDSGRLIPGLGGVLDLVDSLLFAGPLVYLYLVLAKYPSQYL